MRDDAYADLADLWLTQHLDFVDLMAQYFDLPDDAGKLMELYLTCIHALCEKRGARWDAFLRMAKDVADQIQAEEIEELSTK